MGLLALNFGQKSLEMAKLAKIFSLKEVSHG